MSDVFNAELANGRTSMSGSCPYSSRSKNLFFGRYCPVIGRIFSEMRANSDQATCSIRKSLGRNWHGFCWKWTVIVQV